tara:strand:+ start:678 stop:1106 length:429 start_codon:yes stop_codon:yes gene_type:complete
MTFATLHNAIRNRFNDNVVATSSAIGTDDVAYDNVEFDSHDTGESALWVRFQILTGESELRELGSTTARTTGIALASVFSLAGRGDNLSLGLVDEIVSAFKAVTHTYSGTTVVFRTPSVQHIGRDGTWWQTNVTIPFYTDDA